jgi:hypothetical protein
MIDPEGTARTAIQKLDFADRMADVCHACGLHILKTVSARLQWLTEGGEIRCESCNTTKTRTV